MMTTNLENIATEDLAIAKSSVAIYSAYRDGEEDDDGDDEEDVDVDGDGDDEEDDDGDALFLSFRGSLQSLQWRPKLQLSIWLHDHNGQDDEDNDDGDDYWLWWSG